MVTCPRIEYSVFDSNFISREVLLKWGWKRAKCEFWNRGMSDTYRVEGHGDIAYLKIYPYRWRRRSEVQGEIDLLRFLSEQKISVSIPIRNNAGTFIEKIDAPEGRRYAVMFSDAKGDQPKFTLRNCKEYGRLAGTVHKATELLPNSVRRPQLDIDHLARAPLKRIQPFLSRRPRDLAYLTSISEELADAVISLLPDSAPEFGMCHGDLTFGNVRRDKNGRLTLFDFDSAGYGWRAYDVAIFLWSRGSGFSRRANADRLKQWNAFMDGYHSIRCLSKSELQAVDLFVPLRQIWQLGAHTNHLAYIGSRAAHEARFETHLEFIKNWLKAYKPI